MTWTDKRTGSIFGFVIYQGPDIAALWTDGQEAYVSAAEFAEHFEEVEPPEGQPRATMPAAAIQRKNDLAAYAEAHDGQVLDPDRKSTARVRKPADGPAPGETAAEPKTGG